MVSCRREKTKSDELSCFLLLNSCTQDLMDMIEEVLHREADGALEPAAREVGQSLSLECLRTSLDMALRATVDKLVLGHR